MTQAKQTEAIETALMRAHCLSKAIGFMLIAEDHDPAESGSTFRAAIAEVNECAHEAIQIAIDLTGQLAAELGKGGAA